MSILPMKILEWHPRCSVHAAVIDREHAALFGLVNRLHEAMLVGEGAKILDTLVREVQQLGFEHLAHEEQLMAAIHYPARQDHVQEHDKLRQSIQLLAERIEQGETTFAIELALVLSEHIGRHTMTADRRMGDYVAAEHEFTAYMKRLLSGDHRGCGTVVQRRLAEGTSIKDLYVHLLQRSLYRIGELWKLGEASVAQEHLAVSVTESMLALTYPTLSAAPRIGKKTVVACVSGELHRMGAKMVADTFELNGWDACYLGANTPIKDLLELLGEQQPEVLCLSVSLKSHIDAFTKTVKKAHAHYPRLMILAGGQGLQQSSVEIIRDPYLQYLRSLDDLEAWIASQ